MDQRADDLEIHGLPVSAAGTPPPPADEAGQIYVAPGETVTSADERVIIRPAGTPGTAATTGAMTGANVPPPAAQPDAARADEQSDNPDEIRSDIEQTRSQMTDTINAIEERLNPDRLKAEAKERVAESAQQVKDAVHDATIGRVENMVNNTTNSAKSAGNTFVETIRENPVPAALAALGIGWLIAKGRQTADRNQIGYTSRPGTTYSRSYIPRDAAGYTGYSSYTGAYVPGQAEYPAYRQGADYGSTTGQVANQVQNKAGQLSDQVQNKAGQLSDQVQNKAGQLSDQVQQTAGQVSNQVQQTAGQLSDQAQYQAQRAQGWFQRTLDENPLALGALALAAGAVIGLSVPETQPEHQLMGPTRDTLVQRAQDVAQDTAERVQTVAKDAASAAKETAQREAGEQGLTGSGAMDETTSTSPRS